MLKLTFKHFQLADKVAGRDVLATFALIHFINTLVIAITKLRGSEKTINVKIKYVINTLSYNRDDE